MFSLYLQPSFGEWVAGKREQGSDMGAGVSRESRAAAAILPVVRERLYLEPEGRTGLRDVLPAELLHYRGFPGVIEPTVCRGRGEDEKVKGRSDDIRRREITRGTRLESRFSSSLSTNPVHRRPRQACRWRSLSLSLGSCRGRCCPRLTYTMSRRISFSFAFTFFITVSRPMTTHAHDAFPASRLFLIRSFFSSCPGMPTRGVDWTRGVVQKSIGVGEGSRFRAASLSLSLRHDLPSVQPSVRGRSQSIAITPSGGI